MKKIYTKPQIEISRFESAEVINDEAYDTSDTTAAEVESTYETVWDTDWDEMGW